ncbi:MAG: SusC/RagA family TonB-linked outer membrane protein [Tenuifilaceae bacterium]
MIINLNFFRKILLCTLALTASIMVYAQTKTIQGVVTNKMGETMIGVSIAIPGTTIGVITNADGKYSINVPESANSLTFSFIGYETTTVEIGSRAIIDVVLEDKSESLDELVVVGYGTVKKRDLTGSVSSIKSNEIVKTATNNALQSLQGKIAGLDITKSSGESGSGISINLRGNRSVNAVNTPLFLVDGIEYGSTLDLNASDIASIEVLKDASSTAIYGTKGANGVIIITTKRGNTSADKSKVTFNSYLSLNSPTNIPKLMNVEKEYLFQAERSRYAAENVADTWGSTSLVDYPADVVLSNVLSTPYEKTIYELYQDGGVDWFDLIMRNSQSQNYEIGFTGGNQKTSYSLSLGYMNEEGLLRNDYLKRYNFRINLDHNLFKNVKVGTSLQYTSRDWNRRDDNVYSQLIKMHSLAQPFLADGTLLDKPSELATSHTNPLLNEVYGYYINNTADNRLFGNVSLEWELFKGLKFKSLLGIDHRSKRVGEYEDYMCTSNYQSGRGSYFDALNSQSQSFTWENTLNYSLNFGEVHDIQLLVGQSASRSIFESHQTSGFGLQDHYGKNSFYDLTSILPSGRAINNEFIQSSMLSYFGRANYKLFNKYLFTATLRTDGSSSLSEGNKWGYFPSLAAAWILSEEQFLKGVDLINNMKLRVSWGKAGNAAIKPYQTLTVLGNEKIYYTFGTQLINGQIPSILGNPDLTWETTSTFDIGLDFAVLKDKVSVNFDYYLSKTSDLLIYKGLPASSVYPQVLANVGETENRGFELGLNYRVLEGKDFSWITNLSYSQNRDKIVSLASGATQDVSNPDEALIVGEPVRSFYGYEADGCWSIDEAATAALYNKIPGDVKIVDSNNDNLINDLDKRVYNKSPKFIVGWNNTVSYKNFSLSALVYARVGQWIQYDYNTAYKPTEQDGSPDVDFWTPENQGAKFPRPGIASQNDLPALAFEKASFLKIKEVTFGYNLPKKALTKVGMSSVRLYVSLQNYFTFSNLDNYDVERGGSISNPLSKQMVFGLNLEF